MNINWTTIISSAVVAVVIGLFQLVSTRYANRMLDHIEKLLKIVNGKDKDKKA